jgi:hypothetical protein
MDETKFKDRKGQIGVFGLEETRLKEAYFHGLP